MHLWPHVDVVSSDRVMFCYARHMRTRTHSYLQDHRDECNKKLADAAVWRDEVARVRHSRATVADAGAAASGSSGGAAGSARPQAATGPWPDRLSLANCQKFLPTAGNVH
eukprot:11421212-Alexandrium_andersonii.AAC.1